MREGLANKILEYINHRRDTALELLEKAKKQSLGAVQDEKELEAIEKDYREQEDALRDQFEPRTWISRAALRTGSIYIATHIIKFTHGRAKGTNLLCTDHDENPRFLDSGSISNPLIDVTGNAGDLDVAKLLLVEHDGCSLLSVLKQGDFSSLSLLAEDEAEAIGWSEKLLEVAQDKKPSSHMLAKQVFWPIESGVYHLLAPIPSSSLYQEIHDRVSEMRYSETSVAARKAKRNNEISEVPVTYYPDMARFLFGGKNKQNISLGNAKRNGVVYMMPNTPPTWESQAHPPTLISDVFESRAINRFNYRTLKAFSKFLDKVSGKASNWEIRNAKNNIVEQLVDNILRYGINASRFEQGWSLTSNLKHHQRVWLDPSCPEYKDELILGDWISDVSDDFAEWLNNHLNTFTEKGLLFEDPEHLEWHKKMKQGLKDLRRSE